MDIREAGNTNIQFYQVFTLALKEALKSQSTLI